MSPVGHAMVGFSAGILCLPEGISPRSKTLFLGTFTLLAGVPDLPLPGWGHSQYLVSHSLIVNLGLIGMLAGLLRWQAQGTWICSPKVLMGGAATWLSHMFLDSFYRHGRGIAILWPVSSARLVLPMPWFTNLDVSPRLLTAHNVRTCLVEFAFYLPFLVFALCVRYPRFFKRPSDAVRANTVIAHGTTESWEA